MANDPKQLQELYWEIEQHYAPDQGWCDAPACSACDKAELQVEAAKEAARKGFLLNKPAAQKPVGPASQRQIFERGYDKGRNVALQEAHQWAAWVEVMGAPAWKRMVSEPSRGSRVKRGPVDFGARHLYARTSPRPQLVTLDLQLDHLRFPADFTRVVESEDREERQNPGHDHDAHSQPGFRR